MPAVDEIDPVAGAQLHRRRAGLDKRVAPGCVADEQRAVCPIATRDRVGGVRDEDLARRVEEAVRPLARVVRQQQRTALRAGGASADWAVPGEVEVG